MVGGEGGLSGMVLPFTGEWAVPRQSVNSSPFIILNLIDLLLGSTVRSQSETHTRFYIEATNLLRYYK